MRQAPPDTINERAVIIPGMYPIVNYDPIARTYDRRYVDNDYSGVDETIVAFVGPGFNGRILEVGCGTGHWLRSLRERGVRVAGVDLSASMLEYARAQAPDAALVQGSAENLPWAHGSFDRVFYINAFHHFQDKVASLREAARVLRRGGRMMTLGLDPHAGSDRWYIYEYFEPALDIDRRRYPAASQIREWMQALGFENCVTREVQHLPVRLPARASLENGRLDKHVTSQLSVLTDDEYDRGIERIRAAMEAAEARGEALSLDADLRLYATYGSLPS
jgi:ubiquinone/menaquinone biosynthesis C-methylase UbiE